MGSAFSRLRMRTALGTRFWEKTSAETEEEARAAVWLGKAPICFRRHLGSLAIRHPWSTLLSRRPESWASVETKEVEAETLGASQNGEDAVPPAEEAERDVGDALDEVHEDASLEDMGPREDAFHGDQEEEGEGRVAVRRPERTSDECNGAAARLHTRALCGRWLLRATSPLGFRPPLRDLNLSRHPRIRVRKTSWTK